MLPRLLKKMQGKSDFLDEPFGSGIWIWHWWNTGSIHAV